MEILDSGERFVFETGAVRDIQDNKGRCDLLPLDVVSQFISDRVIALIHNFTESGDVEYLFAALSCSNMFVSRESMILEVSKHFEEGCKKYGQDNWRKGINARCYVNSMVRHYLKWLRGDTDEPHNRAFCWNVLCCIWTCENKPELNDYKTEKALSNSN